LLVTNDLGPRAGGIETFILGLLDQLDGREIVIYTAAQKDSAEFDAALAAKTGVIVIRDKSSILIPTPAINRRVRKVLAEYQSEIIWFGAAMPLAWMSGLLKRAGAKRVVAHAWSRSLVGEVAAIQMDICEIHSINRCTHIFGGVHQKGHGTCCALFLLDGSDRSRNLYRSFHSRNKISRADQGI